MKIMLGAIALVLALPVAAVVAIALGPVLLGVLCGVGFALIVFVVGNFLIAAGAAVVSAGKAGSHHLHRT